MKQDETTQSYVLMLNEQMENQVLQALHWSWPAYIKLLSTHITSFATRLKTVKPVNQASIKQEFLERFNREVITLYNKRLTNLQNLIKQINDEIQLNLQLTPGKQPHISSQEYWQLTLTNNKEE